MEQRIEARIAALEAELNSLKALVAPKEDSGPVTSDRRGMMKLMAATAVGAVTGAALLSAQPAAAADGDPVMLGEFNESESPTHLQFDRHSALIWNSETAYGHRGRRRTSATPGSPRQRREPARDSGAIAGALFVDGTGDWWAATTTIPPHALWRKIAGAGPLGSCTSCRHLFVSTTRGLVSSLTPGQGAAARRTRHGPSTSRLATPWCRPRPTQCCSPSPSMHRRCPGSPAHGPQAIGRGRRTSTSSSTRTSPSARRSAAAPMARIQVLSNATTNVIIDVSGYYQ